MWFNFKKKKENIEKKENKSNEYLKDIIMTKALRENKEKELKIEELNKAINVTLENSEELRKNNRNLESNLEILQNTIEKLKEMCNNTKSNVISKNKILKELGE